MTQLQIRRAAVVLATAVMIAVNAMANVGTLNGVTTGQVANRYDTAFSPAGWVFSIWGLIYAGLVAYAVYQALGDTRRLAATRVPYLVSTGANVVWLVLWHYELFAGTMVVMLVLLGSLAFIYRSLRREPPRGDGERWCVDRAFSLYLGWITVATLANLSVLVRVYGWSTEAFGGVAWAQGLVLVALGIAAFVYLRLRDAVFLAVIAWAAAGIALKPGQWPPVTVSAAVVTALVVASLADLVLRRGMRRQ